MNTHEHSLTWGAADEESSCRRWAAALDAPAQCRARAVCGFVLILLVVLARSAGLTPTGPSAATLGVLAALWLAWVGLDFALAPWRGGPATPAPAVEAPADFADTEARWAITGPGEETRGAGVEA